MNELFNRMNAHKKNIISCADILNALAAVALPRCGVSVKLLILLVILASGAALVDRQWIQRAPLKALVRIDPLPHTLALMQQKRYADAYGYLSYFMEYDYVRSRPEAVRLLRDIQEQRDRYGYRLQKMAEGIFLGQSDELEGQIAAIVSDFFVIGDARDLTREGVKWARGQPVDRVTAALSTIGLLASAGSWLSSGTSLSAKPTLSFLKQANQGDHLPKWMKNDLIRRVNLFKKTNNAESLGEFIDTLHTLLKNAGIRGTLVLLDQAEDVRTLQKYAKAGSVFGKKSATFLEITGKTGMNAVHRLPNVPPALVLEASTYGPHGLRALRKLGPDTFRSTLRTLKFSARTSKILYKYHHLLLPIPLRLMRALPTWVLVLCMLYGSALIMRRRPKHRAP